MSDFEVRRLGVGDEDLARAATRAMDDGAEASTTHLARMLADRAHVVLVAVSDGVPVGKAIAHRLPHLNRDRPHLLLYEIDTAPTHRRLGVARALVETLLRIARADGASLWVVTNANNTAAMALYERTGGIRPAADDVVFVYDA